MQMFRAASLYSNSVFEYFTIPEKSKEVRSEIGYDDIKEHNSLFEVSAYTGIKATRIRSYSRKLENLPGLKEKRIKKFGQRLSDLDEEKRLEIYSKIKLENKSFDEVVLHYNLSNVGIAKRIYHKYDNSQ